MSTRDTAARVHGVSWCAKNQNHTCTCGTRFKSTAGLPAPILNPRWSKNIVTPSFPKDHSNISPRKTPDSVGVRPCRHCGSGKHWDNECRHSRKGEKLARVNCIQLEDNDLKAQDDYDNLFYELESDSEEGSDQQDFCRPLQRSNFPNQPSKPNSESLEETSFGCGNYSAFRFKFIGHQLFQSQPHPRTFFLKQRPVLDSQNSPELEYSTTPCSRNCEGPSLDLQ